MQYKWTISLFFVLTIFSYANSLNVLVAKVGGTKSTNSFFKAIIDVLLDQNHTVTFISGYETNPHPNLKKVTVDSHKDEIYGKGFKTNLFELLFAFITKTPLICNQDLGDSKTQDALNEDFDVAILSAYFTECYLSVVYKQKIPFIYVTVNDLIEPVTYKSGTPSFPSVIPNKGMMFSYPLSFTGRLIGEMSATATNVLSFMAVRRMDSICRAQGLCPNDMPSLTEIEKNASLTFCNVIPALEYPVKTKTPSIIYIGGLHIKKNNPLQQDIEDWIVGSGEKGTIYFSLGSAVVPSRMKEEHLKILLNVFRSLEQRVIWKWDEENIEGLSSNVKIYKWLPQQDILAHSNVRMFISHGGLFSLQEATYHGVPVIGIPVFGDQPNNVLEMEREGWGLSVNWDQLSEESLSQAIHQVLKNQTIKDVCRMRSILMKDTPKTPAEVVSYWVEYTVRHRGAPHLKSPFYDMSWFRLHNFDVWIYVIVMTVSIMILIYESIKNILLLIKNIMKRILNFK